MAVANLYLGTTINGKIAYDFQTNVLSIGNNNITNLNFDTVGNIGIGITNPDTILHLQSYTGNCILKIEADPNNLVETDNPKIVFAQDGDLELSAIGHELFGSSLDNYLSIANTIVNAGIIFGTSTNASNSYTDAVERMRISANGAVNIVGTLSKGAGSFVIDHPDPVKQEQGYKLKHCFVESNTTGDNIYRFECEATEDGEVVEVELPSYYKFLNHNTDIWINGLEHFGIAYGKINEDEEKILVTCEKTGKYKILCIGTRKDKMATDNFLEGPEYIPEIL
jgi:hypothetical protein